MKMRRKRKEKKRKRIGIRGRIVIEKGFWIRSKEEAPYGLN